MIMQCILKKGDLHLKAFLCEASSFMMRPRMYRLKFYALAKMSRPAFS